MKILLDWKKPEPEINFLIEALQKEHEVVYHLGFPDDSAASVSRAVFHDIRRAVKAEPAEVFDANGAAPERIDPPSAELIEKMHSVESIVLTMMNRKFGALGVDERKHVYYRMLGYWYWVFKKFTPDVVVFNAIPHATYNYVIYGLARLMGIKTLMFVDAWIPDHMLPIVDYKILSPTFLKALKDNENKQYKIEDLSESLRAYVALHSPKEAKQQNASTKDATPGYLKKQKQSVSFKKVIISKSKGVVASLQNGMFFSAVSKNISSVFAKNPKIIAEKVYRSLAQAPNWGAPYVYMALHYQPERTTSPQGEMYVDQLLVVETLSKALPAGWKIYVKEHPLQWIFRDSNDPFRFGSVRYPSYYKRLADISNVVLVAPEVSSYDLMDKSKAVAAITGKVGMEGLIRGKPILLFGFPWYRFCSELLVVGGVEDCKKAFAKIVSGWQPARSEVIRFLKIADDVTFHGYTDHFGQVNSMIDPKENIRFTSARILKELMNIAQS